MIPLSKPYHFKEELQLVTEVLQSGQLAGNGVFTKRCQNFFEEKYHFNKCLLTNSCTAALEMAALLLDLKKGDEVIVPAYTYVSTANAFALHGAKLVYVDSQKESPNMNLELLPNLITKKTKAIVVMHYGGIAIDMEKVMQLAQKQNLIIIEDAANGVDSFYKDKPLGSFGHLGCYSFHSTKNVTCGHGGLLMINDKKLETRADILWQKGTDKSQFDAGTMDSYQWQDLGSSFFPPEIIAAHLFSQLKHIDKISTKRKQQWQYYQEKLAPYFQIPNIPEHSNYNGHVFYIKTKSLHERNQLQQKLTSKNIICSSHYLSLGEAPFNTNKIKLQNARVWQNQLLRLPLYHELTEENQNKVIACLIDET